MRQWGPEVDGWDIAGLKAARKELDSRKARLVGAFQQFRDSFMGTLKEFASEAIQDGLEGVSAPEVRESDGLLEVSLSLNSFDLTVHADLAAYFLDHRDGWDTLASRMFVYYTAVKEDSTAIVDITLRESADSFHHWEVRMFTLDEKAVTAGKGRQSPDMGGRQAALALMYLFVCRRRAWWERMPRSAYLTRRQEERFLGFQPRADAAP